MLIYMYVVIAGVSALVAYDMLQDKWKQHNRNKAEKLEEYTQKRQNVIRGIFRQHNQQFRDNGFKPPQGSA